MVYFSGSRPFLSGTTDFVLLVLSYVSYSYYTVLYHDFGTPWSPDCSGTICRNIQTKFREPQKKSMRAQNIRAHVLCMKKAFSCWVGHDFALCTRFQHGFSMDFEAEWCTGDRRCDIRISPTFWNHAESMRVQKKIGLLKSPTRKLKNPAMTLRSREFRSEVDQKSRDESWPRDFRREVDRKSRDESFTRDFRREVVQKSRNDSETTIFFQWSCSKIPRWIMTAGFSESSRSKIPPWIMTAGFSEWSCSKI